MLQARRRGFFKQVYELSEHGRPLTELPVKREGTRFLLAGIEYRIVRDGRKRFVLEGPGGHVATAAQVRGREWALQSAVGTFTLTQPSMWHSVWELAHGGRPLGRIRRDGHFTSATTADLAPDVPLVLRVFAYYVVLMILARAAAAAAAAS